MERRRKNETEIITRAPARITTRTGEIPLLIPNLSGSVAVAIFSLLRLGVCIYIVHGYLRIFSRAPKIGGATVYTRDEIKTYEQ